MDQLIEFAGNHPFLTTGTVVTAILVVMTEVRARTQGSIALAPQQAVQLINRGAVVLDTRSPELYEGGHILNARNVPLAELTATPDTAHKSKEKLLLTYCDNGISGSRATAVLRRAGFQNAFNLKGGLAAWSRENLPTVTAKPKKKKRSG